MKTLRLNVEQKADLQTLGLPTSRFKAKHRGTLARLKMTKKTSWRDFTKKDWTRIVRYLND
jgi:hypothetical protein